MAAVVFCYAAAPPNPATATKSPSTPPYWIPPKSLQTERDGPKIQRRATPHKIAIQELREAERPRQLLPRAKTLTDNVKTITYRAIARFLADLNAAGFRHSETGHRFLDHLVCPLTQNAPNHFPTGSGCLNFPESFCGLATLVPHPMPIPRPASFRRLIPFAWRVGWHRWKRARQWASNPLPWATEKGEPADFPAVLSERASPFVREGAGTSAADAEGKKQNLRMACREVNGLVIPPGGVFSFCRTVGPTTSARGFVPGLEMQDQKLTRSPGGGLCQLANLLFGLAVDANAEILERHRHSFDLFPDTDRSVPFGFGATVFYNYVDFQFRNRLDGPMLIELELTDTHLIGRIRVATAPPWTIKVVETDHRFFRESGTVWRENKLWREKESPDGQRSEREFLLANRAKVLYPADHLVDS